MYMYVQNGDGNVHVVVDLIVRRHLQPQSVNLYDSIPKARGAISLLPFQYAHWRDLCMCQHEGHLRSRISSGRDRFLVPVSS
jgi:hypothetical protein